MDTHYAVPCAFTCGATRVADLSPGEAPPDRCVACRRLDAAAELCVRVAIDWPHACSDFEGPSTAGAR
jgi:hypothetical protein